MELLLLASMAALVLVVMSKEASAAPMQAAPAAGAKWRGLPFVASPHHGPRGTATVDTIIIHYTAGGTGAEKWFQNPDSKVSAHFVVARTGAIVQCVELGRAAWHAGDAALPDGTGNVNARSVGIEIENRGYNIAATLGYSLATQKRRDGSELAGYWEPYQEAQVAAVAWLCRELRADYPSIRYILGHDEVCKPIGRKSDPGALWPWSRVR